MSCPDDEDAALTKEPANIPGNDRYLFSGHIRAPEVILTKFRPEPASEPFPPPTDYKPQMIIGRPDRGGAA